METVMTATIPEHLRFPRGQQVAGEILLVSSSGIYLRFGERILLLSDNSWGILPIGIGLVSFKEAVVLLRPQAGQPVTVAEERLVFPCGTVRLIPLAASEPTSENPTPELSAIRRAAEELAALKKYRGISMLVQPLVLGVKPENMLLQNPYCAHGCFYLEKLIKALHYGEQSQICTCVEKLLGLGVGLTPSADDVLLGMLYVFRRLPRKCPESVALLREQVEQLCDSCTSQISAAYLKAVCRGAPFERMERIFLGMCGEDSLDIQLLTEIGSNSGSEMLLGMLIALQICGYDISVKEELL